MPWSKVAILGMVIQPLIGNPYNGYINPYYWVDDHPLLYGNNGSLDPSTHGRIAAGHICWIDVFFPETFASDDFSHTRKTANMGKSKPNGGEKMNGPCVAANIEGHKWLHKQI